MLSYYEFVERCRSHWRYSQDSEVSDFLSAMVESAATHVMQLGPDISLFRAQLGCGEERSPPLDEDGGTIDTDVAYPVERMVPTIAFASDGRVSPRGIVTLYTATDEATAVAEVRPHVGARVTVAMVQPLKQLRIVDCHSRHDTSPFFGVTGNEPEQSISWVELNRSFARPLYDLARTDIYAPTQIVSEWFRRAGYDGVAFKSSLGPGKNVAVFDREAAQLSCAWVVAVRRLVVEYETAPLQRGWAREAPLG